LVKNKIKLSFCFLKNNLHIHTINTTAWKIPEMMVFLQVRDGLKDLPEEGLPVIEMDWVLGSSTTYCGILWPPLEERETDAAISSMVSTVLLRNFNC